MTRNSPPVEADIAALKARATSLRRHMLTMARGQGAGYIGQGVNVPNPSGAYFARISANGSGCPAGSWQAAISDDGKVFQEQRSNAEMLECGIDGEADLGVAIFVARIVGASHNILSVLGHQVHTLRRVSPFGPRSNRYGAAIQEQNIPSKRSQLQCHGAPSSSFRSLQNDDDGRSS